MAGKIAPPVAPPQPKEVPTLAEFWPRFIDGYCIANRQKPSGIAGKEGVFRRHILPCLGSKRIDEIKTEDIQSLKSTLAHRNAKTVNNVLTALSACLKYAGPVDGGLRGQDGLGLIARVPRVRLLKVLKTKRRWYERHDLDRLAVAAEKIDPRIHIIMVLLGGDAGLRRGEIIALKWADIDLRRRQITVERSVWNDNRKRATKVRVFHETVPKGGKERIVTMTSALADALSKHRHLRGERVLCQDDGRELTNKTVRAWLESAQRRAGLEVRGGIHVLRHTFWSSLAAAGASVLAIKELAGLSTSERRPGTCTSRPRTATRPSVCSIGRVVLEA
jgi:integrase